MSLEDAPYASHPRPLTADTAGAIRIPWASLLSRDDLTRHVRRHPGMSWFVPGSQGFLVAGPWRNRADIPEVLESRGDRHRPALWSALLNAPPQPYAAIVVDPSEYRTAVRFYRGVGVRMLEEVQVLRTGALPGPDTEITLEIVPAGAPGIDELLEVDHSAFPWLWRNSRQEFEEYIGTPEVRVWLGIDRGQAVGYVGATDFGGWGHIDRLAVRAERQGHGNGSQLLSWAMRRLDASGAGYVQLSTQGTNSASHRLYSRFGFKPTRRSYKVYGMHLDQRRAMSKTL